MTATAEVLEQTLISLDEDGANGEPANVVDGLFAITRGLNNIASALRYLGNGDASISFGAIEGLGMVLEKGLESIASSIPAGPPE